MSDIRETLSQLPGAGRDLDALVAIHVYGARYHPDMKPSPEIMQLDPDHHGYSRAEDYSTDIAYAWKVFCTARSWPTTQKQTFLHTLANILPNSIPDALASLNEEAICQAAVATTLLEKLS